MADGNVENEEWVRQMQMLDELDQLETTCKEKIHDPVLRNNVISLASKFSGAKRLPLYRLLAEVHWKNDIVEKYYAILSITPLESVHRIIDLMNEFVTLSLLEVFMNAFYSLHCERINELLSSIRKDQIHDLIQILRHATASDIEQTSNLINSLSFKDLFDMLQRAKEPLSDKCRLCKVKRLKALETRLLNDQVPEGFVKTAGVMPIYDKVESWKADDENDFTFLPDEGVIRWFHEVVDLVQICDKCLMSVHKALANSAKLDEYLHFEGQQRKDAERDQRMKEEMFGEVIGSASIHMRFRRLREYCLRLLASQRHGLRIEAQRAEAEALTEGRMKGLALEKQLQQQMIHKALTVDSKWIREERLSDAKRLDERYIFGLLQTESPYSDSNPAPRARRHDLTWKTADFTPNGVPLTQEGAAKKFGMGVLSDDSADVVQLASWHSETTKLHGQFLREKEERERRQREREVLQIDNLNKYVVKRSKAIDRKVQHMEQLLEQEEKERVAQRQLDRQKRREQRFQLYLQSERDYMICEDDRAYKLRQYMWETTQIARERAGMFRAEQDQRLVDRFWGLDLFERNMHAEEHRLREQYRRRVAELNGYLAYTGAIKKFDNRFVDISQAVQVKVAPGRQTLQNAGSRTLTSSQKITGGTDDRERRDATIRKLKAEEIKGTLKPRLTTLYDL